MSRSRFGSAFSTVEGSARSCFAARLLEATASEARAALSLATMPPRNQISEGQMQPAKPGHQARILPERGREKRERAKQHEADAHHRDYAHRKGASRDHGNSVKQHPHSGNRRELVLPEQDQSQQGAG